jgi:parallel beta-helix repeat protein
MVNMTLKMLWQERCTGRLKTEYVNGVLRVTCLTGEEPPHPPPPANERVTEGLQVLYTFDEGAGRTVRDKSGVGVPLDLTIDSEAAVSWKADGGLAVSAPTLISSSVPATKVIEAVMASEEITIEAWVRPANDTQDGPGRIVTLSRDTLRRNCTLGQGRWGDQPPDVYDVRLRTTETDSNGRPSLMTPSGTLTTDVTHVAYTRSASGLAHIYVNGQEGAINAVPGTLKNWNSDYRLALANELTRDRPWLGEIHLVALYDRALSPAEVEQNYEAGLGTQSVPPVITSDPPIAASVGQFYVYEVEATGNPAPNFSLGAHPAGMTIGQTTGIIEWTPTEDQVGPNAVSVVASNGMEPDAVQSFAVEVSKPVPEPPTILSEPGISTVVGERYVYDVEATGSPEPTFALRAAPAGMTINEATGWIEWTPTEGQVGTNAVTVVASNGVEPDAVQSFAVEVSLPVLEAPAILSEPGTSAVVGERYIYDVEATGSPEPTFALRVAPAGMTINKATGWIEWTPVEGQVGTNDVTVVASNSVEPDAVQSFGIEVGEKPPEPPPYGPTYYVAPNGNNSNSGSSSSPWRTIQNAVGRLRPGDTLIVRAGNYHEVIQINRSGTADKPITIRGEAGAVIDGRAGVGGVNAGLPTGSIVRKDPKTGKGFNYSALVDLAGEYVIFEGFEVTRSMGRCLRTWKSGGRARRITIRNCKIHSNRSHGLILYHSDYVTLEGCEIYNNVNFATYDRSARDLNWGAAITMPVCSHITVRNNKIYRNWGEGLVTGNHDSKNVLIQGNTVYDNFALQIYVHRCENVTVDKNLVYHTNDPAYYRGGGPSQGIVLANEPNYAGKITTKNIVVTNNIVIGCGVNFSTWSHREPVTNLLAANNTFVHGRSSDVSFGSQSYPGCRFENNIVKSNGSRIIGISGSGIVFSHNLWSKTPTSSASGPGDVVGDPRLENPNASVKPGAVKAEWYKIASGSPARDAAEMIGAVRDDFFGNPRSANPDIGAHEYG